MGFSWVQNISVGASIDDEDIDEIQTNLNTLYSTIGINYPGCSGAAWTLLPVSGGDSITSAQMSQIRSRADYAQENCCTSDNATDFSTAYDPYNSSVDNTDDGTVYGGNNSSYNATEDNGYDLDDHGTYWNNQDTGYNGSEYASDCGTDDGTYYSSNNSPEYAFADTGFDNDDHGTYNGTNYPGNVSSENTTVCGTDNGTVQTQNYAPVYANFLGNYSAVCIEVYADYTP